MHCIQNVQIQLGRVRGGKDSRAGWRGVKDSRAGWRGGKDSRAG